MGLTAVALAARAKITPNYLGDIETGRRQRNPSLMTVVALARALQVDLIDLLGGGKVKLDPMAVEAARLFAVVSEDVQDAVLQFLQSLAKKHQRRKRWR